MTANSILAPRIRAMGVFSPIASEPEKGTGASRLARYEAWIGRQISMVTDNASETGDWDQLKRTAIYARDFWGKKPVSLLLRIPLLPATAKGQFKQGAVGAFDSHFLELAKGLAPLLDRKIKLPTVTAPIGLALPPVAAAETLYMPCTLIIGLGWENNGNWYPWFPKADPGAYKTFYQRIVELFRSVDPRFRFDWNTSVGKMHLAPDLTFPGTAFVDTIGLDIYDEYPKGSTVYGPGAEAKRFADLYRSGPFGLDYWAAKSAELGKPITVPEWGVADWTKTWLGGGVLGGGDNPYFIEQMAGWFDSLGDQLAYQSYFERFYKGANHSLSRGPMGPDGVTPGPSQFPKSAERFKALFGFAS